jgi:hypothetical protein
MFPLPVGNDAARSRRYLIQQRFSSRVVVDLLPDELLQDRTSEYDKSPLLVTHWRHSRVARLEKNKLVANCNAISYDKGCKDVPVMESKDMIDWLKQFSAHFELCKPFDWSIET